MVNPGSQPTEIELGMRVEASGHLGYVRFLGTTAFAAGRWAGIELDLPQGKNSGIVEDQRYFECRPLHGLFVRVTQVRIVTEGTTQAEGSSSRTSRPNSMVGRSSVGRAATVAPGSRPSSIRTLAGAAATTGANPGTVSRLSRPPASARPRPGIDSSPVSPASTRRAARATPSTGSIDEDANRTPPASAAVTAIQQHRRMLLEAQQLQEQQEMGEVPDAQHQSHGYDEDPSGPLAAAAPISSRPTSMVAPPRPENMVPLKDFEELRVKLRLLESKRAEDRERIKEAEMAKEKSNQYIMAGSRLQAKLADMQQELRDTKRTLKEAVDEKDKSELKCNELAESLDLAELDKDMAEEKAENLQQEVLMLREKVDEMNVDLNVYQQEEAGISNPAIGLIQMERKNERLKEALIKLREVTAETEAELTRRWKNAEKEASLLPEAQAQCHRLKESLYIAEAQVEELKQRLDDAIGAEDMIEQLSEKNISLSEKIEEMQIAIDDLEALKELNDELEENHGETEKQLQSEITLKDNQIRDLVKKTEGLEEHVGDYGNTILQFRELVAHLQGDLDHLRQKEESMNGGLGSQSQAMLSLNLQLQSTAMKAQAKAIDLELRKLDALQANDNLILVQPYLPDGFFKTENDSIQCMLMFKRLAFKADLMNKHLEQQYSITEKIAQNNIPPELVSVCEMRQKLTWFGDMAKRFISFIASCSEEVFGKMGQVYHDLISTERRLNNWVELLRKEELKESDCIVDLQRAIAQMDHLTETYLTGSNLDIVERYYASTRALDLNSDRMVVNLSWVASLFAVNEDGVRLVDTDDIQYQIVQTVSNLSVQAKTCKNTTRKILRKLDEVSSQGSIVKQERYAQYSKVCDASKKLGDFSYEIVQRIKQYAKDRREGVKTESIHQTIHNVTDLTLGISETAMWDGCRKLLAGLLQDVSTLTENIMDPDILVKVANPEKVWVKRANSMKAEVVVNTDAEQKAQSLSDQVLNLIKDAKQKDQELQEKGVTVALLEKRMDTFKKQAEQVTFLERDLEKARQQEREFDKAILELQADMAALENENIQLKRLVKKTEPRGGLATARRSSHGQQSHVGPGGDQDASGSILLEGAEIGHTKEQSIQIESLKSALRFLRTENSALRTRAAMLDLGLTPDMSTLKNPLGRLNTESLQDGAEGAVQSETEKLTAKTDSELKAVALEARRLIKDARIVCASPKVVDLTKHSATKAIVSKTGETATTGRRGWQALKKTPEWEYHAQQAALNTIQQRSNELKERLAKVARSGPAGGSIKLNKLSMVETARIGRVHIPRGVALSGLVGAPEGAPVVRKDLAVYLRSSSEFEAMHQLFVR